MARSASHSAGAMSSEDHLQAVRAVEDSNEVLADLDVIQLHILAMLQQHLLSTTSDVQRDAVAYSCCRVLWHSKES